MFKNPKQNGYPKSLALSIYLNKKSIIHFNVRFRSFEGWVSIIKEVEGRGRSYWWWARRIWWRRETKEDGKIWRRRQRRRHGGRPWKYQTWLWIWSIECHPFALSMTSMAYNQPICSLLGLLCPADNSQNYTLLLSILCVIKLSWCLVSIFVKLMNSECILITGHHLSC